MRFLTTMLSLLLSTPLVAQPVTNVPWSPGIGAPQVELVRVDVPDVVPPPTPKNLAGIPNRNLGLDIAAGDIDGDGFAEIAAGMTIKHVYDEQGTKHFRAGSVVVYRGSNREVWTEIEHPEPIQDGRFGAAMLITDIDGDGFGDLLVTAWKRPAPVAATWIYHGPNLTRIRRLDQPLPGSSGALTHSLAVGDTNGDGHLDFVYANPFVSDPVAGSGAFFVYEGPDLNTVRTVTRPDTVTRLFGSSCAVGDVNGDGFDDVVCTDPYSDLPSGPTAQGRAWLFYGPDFQSYVVRKNPDGAPNIQFGLTCAIGDLNDDGFGEVVLGAPRAFDNTGQQGGAAFVYWGPDIKKGQLTRILNTPSTKAGGAFSSNLKCADMNRDGVLDLVVGAGNAGRVGPEGDPRSGEVNVLCGPSLAPWRRVLGPPICFCGSNDSIGGTVAIADVTGDGRPDIALGAALADILMGRVYYADFSSLTPFSVYRSRRAGDPIPPMAIAAEGSPSPGQAFRVRVSGVPTTSPAWIWMADKASATRMNPLGDGAVLGAPDPGRYLLLAPPVVPRRLIERDDTQALGQTTERRQCEFRVPVDSTLLGQRVRMQAFALDPGDPLGLVESDGLVVTIGDW